MSGVAVKRLVEERNEWRRKSPHGFIARPIANEDGTKNLFVWECGIPGRKNTAWEGGLFKLLMEFTDKYPNTPPACYFRPPIFHPNIDPTGIVCLPSLEKNN
ncbi:unnamed protein product [Gongylonema pulchrum]|uniref:UBIQUITIN_CONJUGAT_2 domain-containing protein n=1 Tax=Gongylonema pulchrum TaxID=637853 RepID=A0A183DQN2_9BILA|nr:unnamed protein product [Gongylonema pulchrum]